jgi:hypothetical protein
MIDIRDAQVFYAPHPQARIDDGILTALRAHATRRPPHGRPLIAATSLRGSPPNTAGTRLNKHSTG